MNELLHLILAELRTRLRSLYEERLVSLVLFGSQARGEAAPDSDIDILVVLQGPVDPGAEIARVGKLTSMLSLKYNTVISCLFLSAERYATEQSPLLLNMRKEGVLV